MSVARPTTAGDSASARQLDDLRADLRAGIAALQAEVADLRADLRAESAPQLDPPAPDLLQRSRLRRSVLEGRRG